MRAKLEITNHVQDVGVRSIITATLIEKGIKKAIIENDDEDPKKVIVIVDEEQETLDRIRKSLDRELRNKDEFPQLSEEFTMSEWEEVNENPPSIPDISPYVSDALQLRQMSKFVGVGLKLAGKMEQTNSTMDKNMKSIDASMQSMSSNTDKMNTKLDKLDKLDSVEGSINKLPENIAKELVKLKKDGVL